MMAADGGPAAQPDWSLSMARGLSATICVLTNYSPHHITPSAPLLDFLTPILSGSMMRPESDGCRMDSDDSETRSTNKP